MNQALGFGTQGDQAAYEFLFDPTDFTFPEWFTTALNQPVRTNEVPAGVPHVEDLRDKIIAESQRRGGPVPPPRGFRGLGFMRLLDEFFDRNFAPVGQEQWGQRTPPLWPGWAMGMNTGRVDRVMRGGVGPRGGRRPSGGRGGRGF